jgi:hypothetical protein
MCYNKNVMRYMAAFINDEVVMMNAVAITEVLKNVPVKNVVPIFDFTGVSIGDAVAAADGAYETDDKVYVVEEGKLIHVFGKVDGQLEMQFEGI